MEEKRIHEINRKVNLLLSEKRLKPAIDLMEEEMDTLSSWELRTRFQEMQTAYKYMLEYMSKGMPDPDRNRLHSELIGKAYLLNDEITYTRLAEHSLSVYCQMRRKYKNSTEIALYHEKLRKSATDIAVMRMMPSNVSEVKEAIQRHKEESNELFMRLWSSDSWNQQQQQEAQEMLNDIEVENNDKAMMISAVTISLLKIFDPTKVVFLCKSATHEKSIVAQRALVGLFITLYINSHRIEYYPELSTSIEALKDIPGMTQRLLTIQIQLLRSRETQKIDRKMREEIIPAMLKNPNLRNSKMGLDIEKDLEKEDKNPEWEAWVKNDNIQSKLDEMAQWQTEGADVYMSTFSQLKHYPFFNEMPNWFRPFELEEQPETNEALKSNNNLLLKTLTASRFFCNSDKYSFYFTFKQVPEEQRNMLMQQLNEQHGDGSAMPDTEQQVIPKNIENELVSNQYIQDLYRFFKLSHFKSEFNDPFTLSLNLLEWKTNDILRTPESMIRIFHHLMQKEYYAEATTIGSEIEKCGNTEICDAQFYQEMGYCRQKAGEYDAAIEYYHKADIIKPDTLWTIRHIAQCHRMKRNLKEAVPYYLQAEQLAPENRSVLLQTGECLAALKKYDDAFTRFFKIEYLDPSSIRSQRAIAWCSFITDKQEQARNYYSKLLASPKRNMQDWLNAGHVELVAGNTPTAIEYYRKAAVLCKESEEFGNSLMSDKKVLLSKGISTSDLILIRDIVG